MMKNIVKYIFVTACILAAVSCSLFQLDNYEAPSETLRGEVIDVATGEPVLTDQGSEGIRVRLIETSWEGNVTPLDFYCRPDGTFQNTKLFEADYNVRVDGPFLPIYLEDKNGTPVVNKTQDIHLKGEKFLTFEVQPFLKVELDETPMVSDGVITARVKVTRGVSKEDFKSVVMQSGDYKDSYFNVTDIQLFVSYSSSCGYRARDDRWSNAIEYEGSAFESSFGNTITITSDPKNQIPSGRTVFIRAAARINYDTPAGSGTRRWNYSEVVEVTIP
jgi:hypothetical protein